MAEDSYPQGDPMADAIWIHSMGFYVLATILEQKGIVTGGEIAQQLRRYECPSQPDLKNALENFCQELEDNPFGPRGTFKLKVIDGGAND